MIGAPSPLRDELVVLTKKTLVNCCLRLRPETEDMLVLSADPDRLLMAGVKPALQSLIVVAPEHLRAQLRGLGLAKQLARIDRFSSPTGATSEHRVTVRTLRSIAARIRFLINQAAELDVELLVLIPQHRARVAGRTRCWTCRSSPAPGQLVPSRTRSQRSSVRLSRRRRPTRSQQRSTHPAPAQPNGRPKPQPRPAHRCDHPAPLP